MCFRPFWSCLLAGFLAASLAGTAQAQRGFGRGGGFGGGGVQPERELVRQYDADGDGRLNSAERKAALAAVGGRSAPADTRTYNAKLAPADVRTYSSEPFYDPKVLRTLFLEFEDANWEEQLAAFKDTDVEVPARLVVDGKTYRDVGVSFRGATSFMRVPAGYKRSLNISIDAVHENQSLYGYRTLNLLNANDDPSFLRTVLFLHVARAYMPALKANYSRVVINGESWGVYASGQQFNSDYTLEAYGSRKGARWKVPGSPRGGGGLAYMGEDAAAYKRIYEIKTRDDAKDWAALIRLCKVLNQTPPERLVEELSPLLDIDETLRFLAVEKVLVNNDGYWTRASDYNLYMDEKGRFHVTPHDANETMPAGGGRGPGGGTVTLDPFAGANDPNKALLYRLLAVPELRSAYLGYIRDIAEKWLAWERLGPIAEQYHSLIAADVAADNRKLYTTEAFQSGLAGLKSFADQRRAYLLSRPEVKGAPGL